ncbi:MAG: PDZ domain-containing protein [Bacteroidota bacterium]
MKNIWKLLLLLLIVQQSFAQGTRILRQPTVSSSHIVFVYANDLWKVKRDGGNAVRLTSDDGYESLPHFSNDEKWIAFTAQYDGNTDVYVIPAEGGVPKRLTYHPNGDFVQGWTPDNEIVFRSNREAKPTLLNKFYKISVDGGFPEALSIPRASFGELSKDGSHIAYVPITFWDPEWRNYRGGQAMPIWIVDMKTKELVRTPQPTKERHLDPVWFNDKVFYLSERDYASNIWSFNPETKEEKQHTFHKQFDIKSLDACSDVIVYEQGGYLHLLNPKTDEVKQLEINVAGDANFARSRWEDIKADRFTNPDLSPDGSRSIFEHRGDIFTIPKEEGSWRNLTQSSGVADRYPVWSPKGDKVAWFSDKSGEYQLMISDQFGGNISSYALPDPTFYFKPRWSPDGKKIAYTDTHYNIWVIDLDSKKVSKVDTDRYAHPNRSMNPVWSPDSKWLTYAKQLDSHFKAIFLYNISSSKKTQITDGMADAITPIWDEGGAYLYFLASTNYGLNSGWLDMSSYDPVITRSLYAVVLSENGKSPTLAKSDEWKKEEKDDDKKDKESTGSSDLSIDLNGISNRIVALKLPAKQYTALFNGPKHTVFVSEAIPYENNKTKIHKYDVSKQKADEFQEAVDFMTTSSNGKYALYRTGGSWNIVGTDGKAEAKTLQMNAKINIIPQEEYAQIFREGWRYMRDFLYVDNVHGAPWDKIYEWYSPWLKHVKHRTDLNYLVDILSGEVSIGHSYVAGGDLPDLDRVPVGLLGCDYKLDKSGYYKIDKIYSGESWNPDAYAPLAIPGLDVNEGDYLIAVNGKPVRSSNNLYKHFEQTADRAIRVSVNSKPSVEGARELTVKPVSNEFLLRRMDWVESNRKKVDDASGGKLAYVYLPNTGGGGFSYFNRYYFSQQDKKGVVIDERNNGGGSAADYMIDIMAREVVGYFNSKAGDKRPWTTPMAGIWGPKVMLINERSGSGGDLLPYMFKLKNLGPLIGTRTWGGLVGTWDTPRFIDNGRMVAPRGGFYDNNGNWAVEGDGIAPDIEVLQQPKLVLDGKDPQLERGINEAMKMLDKEEFQLKPEPEPPVKWRRPEGYEVK